MISADVRGALFILLVFLALEAHAGDPTPSPQDAAFLRSLRQENVFMIGACQAAQTGHASTGVRRWAALELDSLTAEQRDLDSFAASNGFTIAPGLDETWQKRLDQLKTCDEATFDRTFLTDLYLGLLGEKAACTLKEKYSSDESLRSFALKTKASATAEIEGLAQINHGNN